MFYYVILLCVVLFIMIYISSIREIEGFNLGLSDKEKDAQSQMIQINNSFFGNLLLFKERNNIIYAYHKKDNNIYKCKEPDIFSKTQTNWEPIVEISSLNDYDILDVNGKVIVIISNNGMQFFRTDKKEFSDVFTNVIDTTYNDTFHASKIINAKDVNGEGASSCKELANIVNNKKQSDKLVSDKDTIEQVNYDELNAEQCKKYAEDIGYMYKTRTNTPNWPSGCLKRDIHGKEIFYIPNGSGKTSGGHLVNICQTTDTTQKLNDQMESPSNPKIFTISRMTFSLCCVGNGYILICDQVNKQLVALKFVDLSRGIKVEYLNDITRSTSDLYIYRNNTDVYVLEGKLNNLYKYNSSDPGQHTSVIDRKFWLDTVGSKYGLTKEILEETKVYGIWSENSILVVYGLFPRLFETDNNRITLFQFRIDSSIPNVQLEDMIRLPSTVFGSSMRTIYEPLGASNLYYRQRESPSISDFILATNKSSNFLTFYGVKKEYQGTTIQPVKNPPADSSALDDLSYYSQYSPVMKDVDKYLMNSENKTGSREFKEGEYIYFVMKDPILFKGIAMKTLNDVRIRAFELYVLQDGKTFNVSNTGNTIQDNEKNYRRITNSTDQFVYGKEDPPSKLDEVLIYTVQDGPENKSVYTSVVKLKILKLNKLNQESEIGDFSTKFQGFLYGLKLESLEDVERQYASRNASCEADLKDAEAQAIEEENRRDEISQIDKALQMMLKNRETELAKDLCNDYFDKASKYLGDKNITIENKRTMVELYKTSIESCKTLIINKGEYAQNKLSDEMKGLLYKQTNALKNIKQIEDAIENLNTDGSYLKGYKNGYDLLKYYVTTKVADLEEKYEKINPNNKNNKIYTDLTGIESDIGILKSKTQAEDKCGNANYNSVVSRIDKYLKFTEMYNVLMKLMKDKVYDFDLSNLSE